MEIKQTEQLCRLVFGGKFGLERETLRVTPQGYLSQTPHPFPGNPHIDRDFCESQIEIISPICTTISELYRAVECIDRETKEGRKQPVLQCQRYRAYRRPCGKPGRAGPVHGRARPSVLYHRCG